MSVPLWFSNLAFWSLQVALLALTAGLLVQLLRIRQPRALLVLWRAVLALSILLPFLEPWHRPENLDSLFVTPGPTAVRALHTHSSTASHWHFPSFLVAEILGVAILIGIAVRLAILVLGLAKLRQFRRTSLKLPVDVTAALEPTFALAGVRAEMRLSDGITSPVTFGFRRPVILLPERFVHLEARFQSAIACHELLHVRRRDWVQHFAEEIVRAILWFHPAVAWLVARVRLVREQIVDLEVVRITEARKPYLEALLEFTSERNRILAVPAPPFLVERQLVERATLILKEVRMSRRRLFVSLASVGCSVVLASVLAVWAFPLTGAPSASQNAPGNGNPGGAASSSSEPTVNSSTLWVSTAAREPLILRVRGLGTLVQADGSPNLIARVDFAEVLATDIKGGENAEVTVGQTDVKGHVISISLHVSMGTRSADIGLDAPLPKGAAANQKVEGAVDVGRLENVLVIGRPVHAAANSQISIFKVSADGTEAERVNIEVGRVSVAQIEVTGGLNAGDAVILSDMSQWSKFDRIRLKPPIGSAKP